MSIAETEPQVSDAARRSLIQHIVYSLTWSASWMVLTIVYRFRRHGPDHLPRQGGVLIASNHQSHFDPLAISIATTHRKMRFLARASLFRNPLFGWLIRSLGSVPIRDNEGDIGAIKAILAALDQGEAVLVFPEGSRTIDGSMLEFKRGITLLLKRSACPVMPVAIEGAFDAFPRQRMLPRLWGRRVAVMFGAPIQHDELLADGPDAALARLRREIETMRLELHSHLRSATKGRYPPPGAGDESS